MFEKILNKFSVVRNIIISTMDVFLSIIATFLSFLIVVSLFDLDQPLYLSRLLLIVSFTVSLLLSWILSLHRYVVRYFEMGAFLKIILLSFLKALVVTVATLLMLTSRDMCLAVYVGVLDAVFTISLLVFFRSALMIFFTHIESNHKKGKNNIFIFGTTGQNPHIVHAINEYSNSKYVVKGFLSVNKNRAKTIIGSNKVYDAKKSESELLDIFKRNSVVGVLFTSKERFVEERDGFVEFCIRNKILVLMNNEVLDFTEIGKSKPLKIKEINIEDLLERPEIEIDIAAVSKNFKHKVIMVTGAAGSIGSEIARQLAKFNVAKLIMFDMAETPMHNLQLEFNAKYPDLKTVYVMGDVRSTYRIKAIMETHRPSVVFHAAAYKHVPMVESNPCEGVLANVWGSINVAECALASGVDKFIMISTDKAVNPTNVMGATKRVAELCIQSRNRRAKTEFITTRFGNVLGSNGSVIELFKKQIAAGGPLTITHPDIIRYFMTIPEACRLVLQAGVMGNAGEILIFDMGEPVKIVDLGRRMIYLSGYEPEKDIEIKFTGLRPGEKLYEELLSNKENRKSNHAKIQVANSVVPEESELEDDVKRLIEAARIVDIDETIRLLKKIVPEYKSENSVYEKFDKQK